MSNKIGWCDQTINYVWGCTYGCAYCYARRIARRFAMDKARIEANHRTGISVSKKRLDIYLSGEMCFINKKWVSLYNDLFFNLYNFIPTFIESQYDQPLPKKPQRIFLNSMSDIADWKPEWYEKVLEKIAENFQHTFIILTKRPDIYKNYKFPHNVWLGVTIENQLQLNQLECDFSNYLEVQNKTFISIEPIQEKIKISGFMHKCLDWVIVGPETGNRKNKIIAKPEMINPFYDINIPVYMKSSCSKIIDTPLKQEWPV